MSQHLFIIAADTSGSMAESGKILLLRHLCEYVLQRRQYTQDLQGYQLQFLSWAQEVQRVAPEENGCVPLPSPSGRRQDQALISYLQQSGLGSGACSRVLLLTDEEIPSYGDLVQFLRKSEIPALQIIVGAENSMPQKNGERLPTWLPEDINTAITELLIQSIHPVARPENLADLQTEFRTISPMGAVEDDEL